MPLFEVAPRALPGSLEPFSQPVKNFIYAERWLNGGSRVYSAIANYSELQQKYQPLSQVASFSVPAIEMPKNKIKVFMANPDLALKAKYIHEKTASFFVHPQFFKDKSVPNMEPLMANPEIEGVEVTPTSSSRSVLVLDKNLPTHCIKLHCPIQISRFNRKLDARDVEKSVNTSREIEKALTGKNVPPTFGFLPESIGVTIGEGKDAWGYLIREMTPRPEVRDASNRTLLPLFSLYSNDLNDKDRPPLLVDLIAKSGLNPKDFLLNKVMLPIIENWCFLARDLGILSQSHGQNLLLELGQDNIPSRIIFRDLSTYMDRAHRTEMGLSNEGFFSPKKTNNSEDSPETSKETQKGYYSLVYDSFMGHHLFDFLATVAENEYGIEPEELKMECRKKFDECFPEASKFFPNTVHYYSKECVDGFKQEIEDTGKAPEWRPSYGPRLSCNIPIERKLTFS